MTAVDGRRKAARRTDRPPAYYIKYQAWWGRPWPVCREDYLLEPDIPALPDIANYQDRSTT